jgi:Zn-dependent metalloprotease
MRLKYIMVMSFIGLCINSHAQLKSVKQSKSHNRELPALDFKRPSTSNEETKVTTFDFKPIPIDLTIASNDVYPIAFDYKGNPIAYEGRLPDGKRSNKDLMAQSINFLELISKDLKLTSNDSYYNLIDQVKDENGSQHLRFQEMYKGVPIFGREVISHAAKDEITLVNGKWGKTPDLEVNAKLKESVLEQIISKQEESKTKHFLPAFLKGTSSTKLIVYPVNEEKFTLSYHVSTYPDGVHRWEYFVDANSGEVINKFMNSCKLHNHVSKKTELPQESNEIVTSNSANLTTLADGHLVMSGVDLLGVTRSINSLEKTNRKYLIDVNRDMFVKTSVLPNEPEGVIWTIDAFSTSPENDNFRYDQVSTTSATWSNPTAVSSQYNMSIAYDYFKSKFGRNSINGSGGNIISLINVVESDGKGMGNAFWNGAAMFYGNGDASFLPLARGLDVAGHEMSHGVIQNTANLVYQGESGALNESFADVFGVLIDRGDWLVGEDVVRTSAFPSGALRNVQNPHNGAAKNDYGSGFQPKLYSERYLGTQDNGGVHINSGIPNYAFFLFASNTEVGLDRAERVYYRALSTYLTKSSQFIDCKFAVTKAAQDLFGAAIAKIAEDAWTAVGVTGAIANNDPKTKYQNDVKINPGQDLIVLSNGDGTNLYVMDTEQKLIFNPLSETDPISKPSITDDGTQLFVIGKDKKLHYITIDYNRRTKSEQILLQDFNFRNAVISRKGNLLALLLAEEDPFMFVFDLTKMPSVSKKIRLKNPTTATGGKSTGDVRYADAMEFDHSEEFVMYDALNAIKSQLAGEITYWDISFVKIFDNKSKKLLDSIDLQFSKLFSGLPEKISVGNPTFAENSPYIIAFDYLDEGKNEFKVFGANIETGAVGLLANISNIGVPSFSKDDKIVIFNTKSVLGTGNNISGVSTDGTKIKSTNPTPTKLIDDSRNAIWYANGVRITTDVKEELLEKSFVAMPNPFIDVVNFEVNEAILKGASFLIQVYDMHGKIVHQESRLANSEKSIQLGHLAKGMYILSVSGQGGRAKVKVSKI